VLVDVALGRETKRPAIPRWQYRDLLGHFVRQKEVMRVPILSLPDPSNPCGKIDVIRLERERVTQASAGREHE
jgi:hypothetical protein